MSHGDEQTQRLSFLAREAFAHGLEDVRPDLLVEAALRLEDGVLRAGRHRWPVGGRLLVLSAGKAAGPMAHQAARTLGPLLGANGGRALLVTPGATSEVPPGFEALAAEHPVPGQGSLRAAEAAAQMARELGEGDLLLVLLSGGASSLLAAPAEPLALGDLRAVFEALLASGADIVETNIVRKHITRLGGGRLAALAHPATTLTLALSDVPGDDPSSIASGPTVADFSTFAQALGVIDRFGLRGRLPPRIAMFLEEGIRGLHGETLKKGHAQLANARFSLIGSAKTLLEKMAPHLALLPRVRLWEWAQTGGTDYQAGRLARELLNDLEKDDALPLALLSAGEAAPQLPRRVGRGGRAAHFALGFALEAERRGPARFVLLSGATDGADGTSDGAGALVTHESLPAARRRGLDPRAALAAFDSHGFFDQTGELIRTGPTGTNFSDVRIAIAW